LNQGTSFSIEFSVGKKTEDEKFGSHLLHPPGFHFIMIHDRFLFENQRIGFILPFHKIEKSVHLKFIEKTSFIMRAQSISWII